MKKLIAILIACFPLIMYGQETESKIIPPKLSFSQLLTEGDRLAEKEKLDSALVYYLSAFAGVRDNRKNMVRQKITDVFLEIQKQKESEEAAKLKAYKLLRFFFPNKEPWSLSTNDAAWALGPNGKYAVINGLAILPAEQRDEDPYVWEAPRQFIGQTAIAKKGGLFYFVDHEGKASQEGFDFIHETTLKQYFGVQRTDRRRFVESVIDPITGERLQNIQLLREGNRRTKAKLFPFETDKKWGLLDANGAEITPAQYSSIGNFYGGFARASKISESQQDTSWTFLNEEGKPAIWKIPGSDSVWFKEVGKFADGIAWVRSGAEDYSLIFSNGDQPMGPAKNLDSLYIKRTITEARKDGASTKNINSTDGPFQQKMDVVLSNDINLFKEPGKSWLVKKFKLNDQFGYVNTRGDTIIDGQYTRIEFAGISTEKGKPTYLFLQTYQNLSKGLYVLRSDINPISKDTAWVLHRRLKADYKKIGTYQITDDFDYVRVKQRGKWGYLFWDKKVPEQKNTRYSSQQKTSLAARPIPIQYDVATDFVPIMIGQKEENIARVYIKKFDLFFYINAKGEMLASIEPESILE